MLRNLAILSLAVTASLGTAQLQFTEYVGEIKTGHQPAAISGDADGRLYYGTINIAASAQFAHIRMIDDPVAAVNLPNEAGTTVVVMTGKINALGRGVQSIAFAETTNTMFISGDSSTAANGNLWKYHYTPGDSNSFVEDTDFNLDIRTPSGRRSGVSIVSEAGDGLIITCGFGTGSFIDYFNFAGASVGDSLSTTGLYYRHIEYIPQYNIAYPIRNGQSTSVIIDQYVSGIGGTPPEGTLEYNPLVMDGGSNGPTGHLMQGSYYYQAQNQLFLVDAFTTVDPNPAIRVFNLTEGGTSVTLAYTISGLDDQTLFGGRINDVAVIGNRLYVTAYESAPSDVYATSKIYVFRDPSSDVKDWQLF